MSYSQKGTVSLKRDLPCERIGETRRMNCGLEATIVGYRSYSDIDIEFEGGIRREHVQYGSFINGNVTFKKDLYRNRIGETRRMNCGLNATIIEYRNSCDIVIEFEGEIRREHIRYDAFKNGNVSYKHSSDY